MEKTEAEKRAIASRRMKELSTKPISENAIGNFLGSMVGRGMGKVFNFFRGFGDYRIDGNSLLNMNPPEVINKSKNYITLRHREYIADISGTTNFTVQSFSINPGLSASFPWLSGVADNYEEYSFSGVIYEFKSLSGDYNASTSLGAVIMATTYDSLNPVFPDKKIMENHEYANSDKPSNTFVHPVECSRMLNPISQLYVRSASVPSGADQRLYDLGNFQIATVGNPVTTVLGELWVTYEVCLYKPRLVIGIGYTVNSDHWQLGSITSANPLGTTSVLQQGSQIGTTITSGTTLTFPNYITDGNYLIIYDIASTVSAALTAPTPTLSSNLALLPYWFADSSNNLNNGGNTSRYFMNCLLVKVTSGSQTITFGTNGVFPSPITGADLWITQINGNIAS